MLSILIPIYNYNAFPLVLELHKQCLECEIDFEILCQDDASQSELNKANEEIKLLSNCIFEELPQNIGRSKIRNLLASKAKFDWLLFMDCDSILINPNYLKTYIDTIENMDIIYGGRVHPEAVSSTNQRLRWKYGRRVEDKTADQRNLAVYKTLMFNNTLIKKDCFNLIKFDPNLIKYGHEDTLFAYQASLSNFKVKHIDNPVEHGDIDENSNFISKVKNSLNNLNLLDQAHKIDPSFVKILALHHFMKSYKLNLMAAYFFLFFNKIIFKQLVSKNPSLLLFNGYRIGYLCSLKK